jgi:hypothetical protein
MWHLDADGRLRATPRASTDDDPLGCASVLSAPEANGRDVSSFGGMVDSNDVAHPLQIVVDGDIDLVLEPWGEIYPVTRESRIELVLRGPSGQAPEIVHSPSSIEVWAWSGCTATLFIDGNDTYPIGVERSRVPDIPQLGSRPAR